VSNLSANRETWTLRRQFVIPLGILILGIAGLITWSTFWVTRRLESRVVADRFDQVGQQLAAANHPLSTSVLRQIRNYSGLDVLLISEAGTLVASSMSPAVAQDAMTAIDGIQPVSGQPGESIQTLALPGYQSPVFLKSYPVRPRMVGPERGTAILLLPQSELAQQRFALVWAPAVTGMLSVLLMMLVASWIASKLARRIEFLESHVEQLSSRNYRSVVLAGPEDALYRLSERINSLAKQLAIAHDVIAKTERARLISLVANGLAHEIRNSLAGASLLIESVLREKRDTAEPELQMAVSELSKATTSLKRILASDPNTVLLEEADLSWRQIQESLGKSVQHHAAHHHVSLNVQQVDHDCVIPQGTAVLTCLLNLTMNAIEATGAGGAVEVLSDLRHNDQRSRDEIVWRVWDDGPGPPAAIADVIAEPFVTSKREGVGLGLAMVRRVADQMNGELRWFRECERTCFEFLIRPQPQAGSPRPST
jgi:signal transduction histidine kinase